MTRLLTNGIWSIAGDDGAAGAAAPGVLAVADFADGVDALALGFEVDARDQFREKAR